MLGPITSVPAELIGNIFSFLDNKDLSSTSEVCKLWQQVFDNPAPGLYQQRLENVAFLPKDWEEYADVILDGDNPFALTNKHVPLRVLISPNTEYQAITWVPKCVKRIIFNDNGSKEEQCFNLKTAEEVGRLIANSEKGFPAEFDQSSWEKALKAEWEIENSHWEWIDFRPIAKGEVYNDQEDKAKKQGNGADVSMSRASIISLLMHKKKFEKRCSVIKHYQGAYIHFKDIALIGSQEERIIAWFAPLCLRVDFSSAYTDDIKAVVVSRKFFGC